MKNDGTNIDRIQGDGMKNDGTKNWTTGMTLLLLLVLGLLTSAHAQITPLGDAFTNTADPSTNYGANVLLDVNGATEVAYIQFNLASIPASASVSEATLKLYVNAVTKPGTFNVDYVNGTWAESTITSSLAPALGASIATSGSVATTSKNQYILINVTAAVQAWLSGSQANDGLALVANSTFAASFDSKESTTTSHPPELDIVFAGGGGGITGITTASGSGLIGGGTSGTLNLALTNTCASGQVLAWNGTVWACATPKGSGTITGVIAGADLSGGGTSGNVTLNLNTANVPLLSATNSFTGVQNVSTSSATAMTATTSSTNNGTTAVLGWAKANSGETFGVYGESQSPSGYGVYGSNVATTGTTAGVYGITSSTTGYGVEGSGPLVGVYGIETATGGAGVYGVTSTVDATGVVGSNSATTGIAYGVSGAVSSPNGIGVSGSGGATGVVGNGSAIGVGGNATSASGTNYGVQGTTSSPAGYGVEGQNQATTGTTAGVYGATSSTAGYGVEGSGPNVGVLGQTTSTTGGAGVYGNATATSGTTYGVYGKTDSPNGYAIYGNSTQGGYGVEGTSLGVGVFGNSPGSAQGVLGTSSSACNDNCSPVGVQGSSSDNAAADVGGTGVYGNVDGSSKTGGGPGQHSLGAGIWGDAGGANGTDIAVFGTADENPAAYFENNGSGYTTLFAQNDAASQSSSLVFQTAGSHFGGTCAIDVSGNLTCNGKVTAVVNVETGARKVALYSVQSPENWFEDAGSGQLSNGSARIELDPAFAQTVNAGVEYHVFLTPKGDSEGLYVSNETPKGFEVREQRGGTSNIAFDYRIMAKRKGYENVRLEDLTEQFNQQEAERQKLRNRVRPSAERRPRPAMTVPPHMAMPAPPRPALPEPLAPPPAPKMPKLPVLPVRAAVHPEPPQPK
jgi:hypothetical protein